MSYLQRYILILLFMTAIPHIIYESVKYYNPSEKSSLWDWFLVNVEYEWHTLRYDITS